MSTRHKRSASKSEWFLLGSLSVTRVINCLSNHQVKMIFLAFWLIISLKSLHVTITLWFLLRAQITSDILPTPRKTVPFIVCAMGNTATSRRHLSPECWRMVAPLSTTSPVRKSTDFRAKPPTLCRQRSWEALGKVEIVFTEKIKIIQRIILDFFYNKKNSLGHFQPKNYSNML